jgi:ferric-dicitrate binding protein FerR (iron transport regulator)
METSIEDRPVVRDYFTRGTRVPYVRAVCMLVAAVALASSAIRVDPMHVRYYETAADQHRTINCSNSSITLNAQSRIAIQCTRSLLRVRVLHGEASFRTTPDPSKSALVLAGDAQVYDFGSTFSVRRSADRTTVTVVEGFVELSVVATQRPRRTVDQKPVWAGERATVMNAGSELELGTRRIASAGPNTM